jgi:hypothetical protein
MKVIMTAQRVMMDLPMVWFKSSVTPKLPLNSFFAALVLLMIWLVD